MKLPKQIHEHKEFRMNQFSTTILTIFVEETGKCKLQMSRQAV